MLPTSAAPGKYLTLIGAQLASQAKGPTLNAGAAAKLSFTVEPSSTLAAWWLKVKTFLKDREPWTWAVPLALALALLAMTMRRRFVIRLEPRA